MIFTSTLQQMAFLLTLMALGFALMRLKAIPGDTDSVLSRLENNLFIPAMVLSTFLEQFTIEKLGPAVHYMAVGLVVGMISIPVAFLLAKFCSKDPYERKLYTYGLAIPNFGYMGNAVMVAVFPKLFMDYLNYTRPLTILTYIWAIPVLLIPKREHAGTLASRLKNLLNPAMVATVVGMALGLLRAPVPGFLVSALDTLGSCMSPVAMLLMGMALAKIDLRAMLSRRGVYLATLFRLALIPLAFLGILMIAPIERNLAACMLCELAMPLGLNSVIIPLAYGKDPSVGAGMALVSHVLSCVSIPAMFALFEMVMAMR